MSIVPEVNRLNEKVNVTAPKGWKFYYRYKREHRQRQRHLEESRVSMSTDSTWSCEEKGKGGGRTRGQGVSQETRSPRKQKGRYRKWLGLYRQEQLGEGQPNPWLEESRVGGGVHQPG